MERYRPAKPIEGTLKKPSPPRFRKGEPRPANAGRRLGTPNKTTGLIKDAIAGAAEQLGMLEPIYNTKSDGSKGTRIIGWKPTGKGGTTGYLVWLGSHYPNAFASLMSRMIPLQVNADVNNNTTVTARFANMDVSSMSLTEKMAAFKEAISLTKPMAPRPKVIDQQGNDIDGE